MSTTVAGEARTAGAVAEWFRVGGPFFLIAGPCVLEDDRLNLTVGEALARMADELRLPIVFKASFDKANRSSPGSPGVRGWRRGWASCSGCARPPASPS